MQGIGELFGSSFDDVIRRPTPAAVPAVADVVALLAGALVYATATGGILLGAAPRALPEMPFAVPEALPSVTQLRDPTTLVVASGLRGVLALAAVAAVTLPLLAYVEAGFIGLLLETYLHRRDDPLADRPDSLAALRETFLRHARRSFGPLLVLRVLQAGIALAAIVLPRVVPYFRNSLLGLVVFDFLFLFAPFIVVVHGRGALAALRESLRTVSDYLASSLVALLFGLLTLGGFGALLAALVRYTGHAGVLAGAFLLAPIGTVLTLFYLKVYLSFRPGDWLPRAVEPAPVVKVAPADA